MSGQFRVLRGGSWMLFPGFARVSERLRDHPGHRFGGNGVRCGGEVFATVPAGQEARTEAPLANPGPAPREPKVNPKDGLKYLWIPPGSFQDGLLAGGQRMQGGRETAASRDHHQGFLAGPDGSDSGRIQALCSGDRTANARCAGS